MNIHKNARLTPYLRVRIVERVRAKQQTPQDAAAACGVSERTIHKWLARHRSEGVAGLHDRSSRPHRSPRRTSRALVERVISLRRQRWTGRHIAQTVGLSPATVSRILRREGLNRIRDLLELRSPRRGRAMASRIAASSRSSARAGWVSATRPKTRNSAERSL